MLVELLDDEELENEEAPEQSENEEPEESSDSIEESQEDIDSEEDETEEDSGEETEEEIEEDDSEESDDSDEGDTEESVSGNRVSVSENGVVTIHGLGEDGAASYEFLLQLPEDGPQADTSTNYQIVSVFLLSSILGCFLGFLLFRRFY